MKFKMSLIYVNYLFKKYIFLKNIFRLTNFYIPMITRPVCILDSCYSILDSPYIFGVTLNFYSAPNQIFLIKFIPTNLPEPGDTEKQLSLLKII